MKTLHTIYTNFAKRLALTLTLLLTLGVTSVWGAEEVMFPNNGTTFNSNWEKTSRTARQTYAASTAAIQLMGENGGVYGEIYSKNTYTGISAVSVKATASKSLSLKLYYSTDQSTWTELSSISLTKSTTSYSSKSFTVTGIPSGAVYLKFRSDASSTYIYSVTVTTASGYAVTYNNGGRGTAPSNTTASSVTLSAITATGYTNTGWKANVAVQNGSNTISAGTLINNGTTVTLTQATTFTAQWQAKTYTITLNNQSADIAGTTSISATYNSNANLISNITIPQKNYHNFGGYYTQTNGNGTQLIDSEGNINANAGSYTDANKLWKYDGGVTLYAKWTEKALTNYRTSCSTETTVSVIPKIMKFWQSIFGVYLGYIWGKTGYRHVPGGIVVVSLHHRCTKIDFHHINMSKTAFAAKPLFRLKVRGERLKARTSSLRTEPIIYFREQRSTQ